MQAMKVMLLAAAMVAASGAAFAQSAESVHGLWRGVYWGNGEARTNFAVQIDDLPGPEFAGKMAETNNFGDPNDAHLWADIFGEEDGNHIHFIKVYNGTGGVSHTVNYSGRYLSARRIVGSWEVNGGTGRFEMSR